MVLNIERKCQFTEEVFYRSKDFSYTYLNVCTCISYVVL